MRNASGHQCKVKVSGSVTLSAKNDILISHIQGLFFSFVLVALFVLLHDHRISVFWLGVQSFIQFYFPYVRRHALDYSFPKHVYSVAGLSLRFQVAG